MSPTNETEAEKDIGKMVHIRNGEADDWAALAHVFHTAVREGARLYTEAQRAAWSPEVKALPDWSVRMTRQMVWLAEVETSPRVGKGACAERVGFLTLELNGYIDCAYILPHWQGRGVFSLLYQSLERQAIASGLRRIYTHASLHARPAFAARGFRVCRPETVEMTDGIWLPRFAMEKQF